MKRVITTLSLALVTLVSITQGSLGQTTELKVGGDPNFPPMAFVDQSGKEVGFDIDFANALAQKMNMKLNYQGMAFDGLIPALLANKIDVMTVFAVTEKRKKIIAYAQPILNQNIIAIVANNNTHNPSVDDLKTLRVGVQGNSSAAATLDKLGIKAVSYNTLPDELNDILLGRLDAVAVESTAGRYTLVTGYPGKLRVSDTILSSTPLQIAPALRQADTALIAKMNDAITAMKNDGTLDTITKKWFGDTSMIAK